MASSASYPVPVRNDGVPDFEWPVSREELLLVRTGLLRILADLRSEEANVFSTAVSLALFYVFDELLVFSQSAALAQRAATNPYIAELFGEQRIFSSVTAGRVPIPSPLLQRLREGPPHRSLLGRTLRQWAFSGETNVASLGWFSSSSRSQRIFATRTHPMILAHARGEPSLVRLKYISGWYDKSLMHAVDAATTTSFTRQQQQLLDALVAAVCDEIGTVLHGRNLHQGVHEYTSYLLYESASILSSYLGELLTRYTRPISIWTGSGGNIWQRLLRHAVKQSGGRVVGHDHGAGSGHKRNELWPFIELDACDVFIAFNDVHAQSLEEVLEKDHLYTSRSVTIQGVPMSPRPFGIVIRARALKPFEGAPDRRSAPQIRSAMYLESFYIGERAHFGTRLPDLVALDWEARLFARLSGWGIRVLNKPHPASRHITVASGTEQFARLLPAPVPFEEVAANVDCFLFLTATSTSFAIALTSRKPIVLFDLGLTVLTPHARSLLSRRCHIVNAWLDDANRVRVDWDELETAMTRPDSRDVRDTSFVDHYLNSDGWFLGAHRPVKIV